jgi:hypothetical protein
MAALWEDARQTRRRYFIPGPKPHSSKTPVKVIVVSLLYEANKITREL